VRAGLETDEARGEAVTKRVTVTKEAAVIRNDCASRSNHQGVGNRLLTPLEHAVRPSNNNVPIERRERLRGLLNFYYRRAA
jgi:hypothetical protein